MKISKTRLKEIIKEELQTARASSSLPHRVKSLLADTAIDEEAISSLTKLVYDLERRFPVPTREPRRGEVQFFERD
jgi:hypothetical protein